MRTKHLRIFNFCKVLNPITFANVEVLLRFECRNNTSVQQTTCTKKIKIKILILIRFIGFDLFYYDTGRLDYGNGQRWAR